MECNYLKCMFIQTMKFTNILQDISFHIVYINGHTSAALHSIQKPKRHFDKALIKPRFEWWYLFSFALCKTRAMPR